MLRCGISLPALKELMGHKDIRMTLRYLKVTQPDLQREFYRARHNTAQPYCIPSLSVSTATSDLPGIRHALAATRHLLEMYRRQLSDDKLVAAFNVSTDACWTSINNSRTSQRQKNEERLAGQSAGVRNSEKIALGCPVMPIADGLVG